MMQLKKYISFILITSLILSGMFFYTDPSYGLTQYVKKTYYRLDTGVVFLWKNSAGSWQYERNPGGQDTYSVSLSMPGKAVNLTIEAYDRSAEYEEKGFFPFSATGEIGNDCIIWNKTDAANNKKDYDNNYFNYAAAPLLASGNYTQATGNLKITYDVTFNSFGGVDYDVKTKLMEGASGKQEIIDLLGSPSAEIMEAMDLMDPESENYSPNVEGYLYFLPVVIKYDVVEEVEINDFQPALNLPSSAKQGEVFDVTDATLFEDESEFDYSELTFSVDGGMETEVSDWDGSALGASVSQSFDEICTVDYTLRVWNTSGESKSVTESIDIVDGRSIAAEADLVLPPYTYQGHSELAEDQSAFTVDGTAYSAARAYAEGVARNSFSAASNSVSISRLTDTKANVTFSEIGNYPVTLNIRTADGKKVSDTESITVRKTPYIIDSLSGFQKQNRKQILTAMVATTPGKPLTDYAVTLKDKVTGETVTLTPGDPQENTNAIKTRTMRLKTEENGEFAYIIVEFLTKTPAYDANDPDFSQQFYYQIKVEDSKGDTDSASRYFDVTPDIPPMTAISIDTAFLRNEGTNVASIEAEDVTVAADGDDVTRTWYYGVPTSSSVYTEVSTMNGYSKLSFGTDKIVGFDRTGVGPFAVRLAVVEEWTEPTLEEYIVESDYLTGTAIAYSEVQNVAPVVSMDLLSGTEQEILLLASGDEEYLKLLSGKTALQQELLANQIDGQIIIKKLLGSTPGTSIAQKQSLVYPYGPTAMKSSTLAAEVDDTRLLSIDSENTYFLTYTWSGGIATVPKTIHAIDTYTGEEVWSYTTSRKEDFIFGKDDTNQYLYLIYEDSNQTVLLDKRTGAAAGAINVALSEKVWLSDTTIFYTAEQALYAFDTISFTKILICDDTAGVIARVGGDLQFVQSGKAGIYRCSLDMETFDISKSILAETGGGAAAASDYDCVCIDSNGSVVLYKHTGTGTDRFRGIRKYSADNDLMIQVAVTQGTEVYGAAIYPALDEDGECRHVMVWLRDASASPDKHILIGISLDTGTSAYQSKATNSYNQDFADAFESNGTSYFLFNGWYMYPGGSDYRGNNYTFSFTGSSCGFSVSGPSAVGTLDENIQISDRSIAALNGDNDPSDGTFSLRTFEIPRTLVQETAEIIARFTDQLTFIGGVNTTADEITAAAETPAPSVKITAAQDGCVTLYHKSLDGNKKYYYEYDIKPLAGGAEDSLTGMNAETATTTSSQPVLSSTYYVCDTYYEDFGDHELNDFFTVVDAGSFVDGYYGVSSDSENTYAKLSFTVPPGKEAILSFDYWLYIYSDLLYKSTILVDGTRLYEDFPIAQEDAIGHCVYQNILAPGTHTIECNTSYDTFSYKMLIDNLTVETVSATRPMPESTCCTQEGDSDGWLMVNGSFETPNGNISYGSQASTYWSGALLGTATAWYKKSKYGTAYPVTVAYSQTIPSGYYGRGYLYPFVGFTSEESKLSVWNHEYTMYEESSSSLSQTAAIKNGYQVMLGNLQPATTYTYTLDAAPAMNSNPYINPFILITYPVNAVTATGNIVFDSAGTKYYFPKEISTGLTDLRIYLPAGEYLIRNLKIYYMEDGQKIYVEKAACRSADDLAAWTLSTGLTAADFTEEDAEPDDEYVRIYKKGEKVIYQIYYSDYEEDPSKIGYWRYEHVNWPPDPVHPDAGKTLAAPVERFYLSGKYTVTHWEEDNTQRPGTTGDASAYDKESNRVAMTFYVDGGGEAPWITYIKTDPAKVRENCTCMLRIGVDDEEKDTLKLTTELYFNGSLILTDTKTGIEADESGDYPQQVVAGIPPAVPGVYQVVCTVSDYSGTGIKAYRYTVVSEGSIDGHVHHTDQWDLNRKKYNLKRFGEEVDRALPFDDYVALPTPRKRGTNVFWSGERFQLRAETEGDPVAVTVRILSEDAAGNLLATGYSTELTNTGKTTGSGSGIWEGSLWNTGMINQWGRNLPIELTFRFTAEYAGGTTREDTETVIMDSDRDYWQLHRLW